VSAGLQHEASAVEVEAVGRVMALVQDGGAAGSCLLLEVVNASVDRVKFVCRA
jgi:hypothetical protein